MEGDQHGRLGENTPTVFNGRAFKAGVRLIRRHLTHISVDAIDPASDEVTRAMQLNAFIVGWGAFEKTELRVR